METKEKLPETSTMIQQNSHQTNEESSTELVTINEVKLSGIYRCKQCHEDLFTSDIKHDWDYDIIERGKVIKVERQVDSISGKLNQSVDLYSE